MVLPQPYALRHPHSNHILNQHNLEDCAPADMGDKIKLICFNSNFHGSFSKAQKRVVLQHIISDKEEQYIIFAATKLVLLNQVCIFKYVYSNKLSGEEVTQIGVVKS